VDSERNEKDVPLLLMKRRTRKRRRKKTTYTLLFLSPLFFFPLVLALLCEEREAETLLQ